MTQRVQPKNPVIDWNNPLAKGLVFCWVPTDVDRDLANDRSGAVTGSLAVTVDQKYGIGADFTETQWIEFTHIDRYSSDFVSATCIVNPDNLTGANYQEVMRKGDNSGTQDYDLLINFPSGGEINFNIWNSGAKSSDGAPLTIGETSIVTGTYDGDNLRMYKSGLEVGTPTAFSGVIEKSTDSIGIGARVKGTVDRKTDAQIYFVAVHNRALSASEIKSLHENPWQIFRSRELYIPLIGPGDTPVTLEEPPGGPVTATGGPVITKPTATGGGYRTIVKITDVNTTETWQDGATGIVISGTGFV